MDSLVYWLWLSLRCTIGSETFSILNKTYSKPSEIFFAEDKDIEKALASYKKDVKRLLNKDLTDARRVLDYCVSRKIKVMTYESPEYPDAFRTISSPPIVIYYYGTMPDLNDNLLVSVVGTRKMSDYGKKMAFEISHDLATAGAVVVSGMALGIDGVAHAGAMSGGGKTVAILGCGIDRIYPPSHKKLYSYIIENGAVMTEFPPTEGPERYNFPKRNRLISAISSATVVIEGNIESGSLITGHLAKMQNKTVYALPRNIDEENGEGTALLLREGAKCITCADDVVSDFSSSYNGKINIFKLLKKSSMNMEATLMRMGVASVPYGERKKNQKENVKNEINTANIGNKTEQNEINRKSSITEEEKQSVFTMLGKDAEEFYNRIPENDAVYIESIAEKGKITEAMSTTTLLEVYGLIESLPGNRIRRK